jgi:hypothetical protein
MQPSAIVHSKCEKVRRFTFQVWVGIKLGAFRVAANFDNYYTNILICLSA